MLKQYENDGLVLFLGAGVSLQSGIPNWRCLAERVLRKLGRDYCEVETAFPSLIAQFDLASHLASLRAGNTEFIRLLYECLYQDLESKELIERIPWQMKKQCGWKDWPRIVDSLRKNRTLEVIGDLLIVDGKGGLKPNPQIHAVLTTNTDNLLEIYCYAKTWRRRPIVTMVDRASVGDHPDTIPIHHLHGSLDVRGENFLKTELSQCLLPDLVFRESDYYDAIANPSAFVNHTPQSYFRQFNVLFVGTSLEDQNIRRWLYQSYRERLSDRTKYLREWHKHDYKDAEYEAALESVRHFWLRPATERVGGCDRPVPRDIVELSMRNLGVQLVWCDDYSEMQNHIRELKVKGLNPNFGRPVNC